MISGLVAFKMTSFFSFFPPQLIDSFQMNNNQIIISLFSQFFLHNQLERLCLHLASLKENPWSKKISGIKEFFFYLRLVQMKIMYSCFQFDGIRISIIKFPWRKTRNNKKKILNSDLFKKLKQLDLKCSLYETMPSHTHTHGGGSTFYFYFILIQHFFSFFLSGLKKSVIVSLNFTCYFHGTIK